MFRKGIRVEAYICREQYTRCDREELHPEINNDKYIEHETITDSTGKQIDIAYGYKIVVPNTTKESKYQGSRYWWIDRESAKELMDFYKETGE